jgi:penicillin-binding protein 1A
VGSANYRDPNIGGAFDVIRSPRQPGSSFKPYVYEAALKDRKITLASCVQDVPTDFNGYKPLDYDNSYMGTMTAHKALTESRNVPAVAVAQQEGIGRVIQLAGAFGVRAKLQPYLSTAIGASEVTMFDHVQGYQVFANQGLMVPLMTITEIREATGRVLRQTRPGGQQGQSQVATPAETYLVTHTLRDYQDRWSLGWNRSMASKSGTSGSSRIGIHQDAWMLGYNQDLVVGAWVGNSGRDGAGNAMSAFGVNTGSTVLRSFINGVPPQWNHWYDPPPGVVGKDGEVFLAGTENATPCQAPPAPPRDGGGGGGGGGGGDGD